MKKLITILALLFARQAVAAVTAELSIVEKGKRIEARVHLAGIADCPTTGSVTIEWTSPDKFFVDTKFEAPWRSCALDTGEANTWAYRTVDLKDVDGKHRRAVGIWKVRVLAGDKVMAEGSIEVK